MDKLTLIACLAAILAIAGGLAVKKVIAKQKDEISRQRDNINVLTGEAIIYKTKLGRNAEQVQALSLKNSELDVFNKQLADRIKDLGIKLKDVSNANVVEAKTNIEFVTVTRVDTLKDVREFEYFDGWNRVAGRSRTDSTEIYVESLDTIDIIGSVKQRRFLFFRIGKPKIQTTISNSNPKSRVHVNFSANF